MAGISCKKRDVGSDRWASIPFFSAHRDHIGKAGDGIGGCSPFTRTDGTVDQTCNSAADDFWPSQQFYRLSDHYNLVRAGAPILCFTNGTHPQSHRADDEVPLVNKGKFIRVAQLASDLGVEIATTTARPQIGY